MFATSCNVQGRSYKRRECGSNVSEVDRMHPFWSLGRHEPWDGMGPSGGAEPLGVSPWHAQMLLMADPMGHRHPVRQVRCALLRVVQNAWRPRAWWAHNRATEPSKRLALA